MARLFLECTIRAALIVVGTALVLYALRVKVASVKHCVWTGVLLLMLVLPLWTEWGPRAQFRLLPASVERAVTETAPATPGVSTNNAQTSLPADENRPAARPVFSKFEETLLGLYLFGAVVLLVRLAIGTAKANRLVRESVESGDIRTNARCAAPVTVGCLRPMVILPEGWREWRKEQLEAVLAHEREHVRRRDPLVQWLTLLNRAIFWFHPAAWWLERELSALAEESCDAAVIAQGHDPRDYAEALMNMARAVMKSGSRVNLVSVAMPGARLPQRIRHIIEAAPTSRISRARVACIVAACAAICVTFLAGTLTRAQSSGAPASEKAAGGKMAFDVASVKERAPGSRGFGVLQEPGGRFTANNATLRSIVSAAYGLDPQRMIAAPEFDRLLSERFNIDAKAQGNPTEDQMNLMLQALLADRFKLVARHETRQLPVLALLLSKPGKIGPQLIPHTGDANCPDQSVAVNASVLSSIPCGNMMMGRGRVTANKINIGDFAASLSGAAGRLVQDRTGLSGTFDLTLRYTPEQQPGPAPGPDAVTPDPLGPSLFTALQEQLGLKLDSQVAPVDVVVIDHIEEPTAN